MKRTLGKHFGERDGYTALLSKDGWIIITDFLAMTTRHFAKYKYDILKRARRRRAGHKK